ncbi:MAG: cytochrome c family protein [Alphaproteobacteria bacterium]
MSFAPRVLLLAIVLAGCGQPASSPSPSPTPPAQAVDADAEAKEIAAALAKLPAPYNGADYDNGHRIFQQCAACHLIAAGAGNSVGPNLHGVLGRKAGTLKDFDYSAGLKKSGIVWDSATLDKWLTQPQSFVPNTRMTFLGVKKPDDRRDVIAYVEIEQAR